jgi:Flp pilus assembly protein TadD
VKLFLILMLACAAIAEDDLPPALVELFNKAVEAQKAGRLDTAEKAFLEVLSQGGRKAFVHNNLGIIYQQRGDHERAVAQFREAVRLDANYAPPRVLMGTSLLALGRTREATAALERAIKIAPREPAARLELARAYERSANFMGAVEQFRELRALAPRDPEYAYQLGRAYMRLSASCLEQLTQAAPGSARVNQAIAENLMTQGRTEEAVRAYHRVAESVPDMPEIHLALAQVYIQQGKAEQARLEIDRELAIVPDSAAALELKRRLETGRP